MMHKNLEALCISFSTQLVASVDSCVYWGGIGHWSFIIGQGSMGDM